MDETKGTATTVETSTKEKTGDKSYSDYKKTGTVKGMIGEKLSGLFSEE